jgi:DNA-binding response OmpR family regulator
MGGQSAKKRALILSDTDDLLRTIEPYLDGNLDAVYLVMSSLEDGQQRVCRDHFDLVVLGVSLPDSEPAAMLFGGTLCGRVDRVPVLIISQRAFFSDPGERIFYFDLPGDRDRFRKQIAEILRK